MKPQSLFDITPTVAFNMFSRCPVMSVPSGSASNHLPTGVQIAAAPFDESAVCRDRFDDLGATPVARRRHQGLTAVPA